MKKSKYFLKSSLLLVFFSILQPLNSTYIIKLFLTQIISEYILSILRACFLCGRFFPYLLLVNSEVLMFSWFTQILAKAEQLGQRLSSFQTGEMEWPSLEAKLLFHLAEPGCFPADFLAARLCHWLHCSGTFPCCFPTWQSGWNQNFQIYYKLNNDGPHTL